MLPPTNSLPTNSNKTHDVTRCTYYERYTTEDAIQAAAKSYGGFTDKDIFLKS